jgi:AraC family transcriptional activator of pobA
MNRDRMLVPTVILDDVKAYGVQVVNYSKIGNDHFVKVPHRDIDFLFAFAYEGFLKLIVDFQDILIPEKSIYFILPGQIHQHIDSEGDIWVIAIDPSLINDVFKSVLNESCFAHVPTAVSAAKAEQMRSFLNLFAHIIRDHAGSVIRQHIKRGFIDALAGMFTEEFAAVQKQDKKDSRAVTLTNEFRNLLFLNYKRLKSPSDYAQELKVSTPYLNEAIKLTSGRTVSYWIQHMITIEAKRLLFYTDKTIKTIAYELGYSDQAYFTRVFTKAEKASPQAFRDKNR